MSVQIPTLLAEESARLPTIVFRLTQMAEGVAIEAKHSEDRNWQTLIEIGFNDVNQLEVRTRDLHELALLEIADVAAGKGLRTRFVSKSVSQ